VIVLTLKSLQEIKSSAGHEAYQAALRYFALRIRKYLRITDICSRYGMDKIMIALPNTEKDEAERVCEKLASVMKEGECSEIKRYPGFCFSVAAGIAQASEEKPVDEVVAAALSEQNIFYEFNVC